MLWLLIGAGCLALAAFWIIIISSSRQDLPRCGSTWFQGNHGHVATCPYKAISRHSGFIPESRCSLFVKRFNSSALQPFNDTVYRSWTSIFLCTTWHKNRVIIRPAALDNWNVGTFCLCHTPFDSEPIAFWWLYYFWAIPCFGKPRSFICYRASADTYFFILCFKGLYCVSNSRSLTNVPGALDLTSPGYRKLNF